MIDPPSMSIAGSLEIPGGKCRAALSPPHLVHNMLLDGENKGRADTDSAVIGNVSPDHGPRGTSSRIYKGNLLNRFPDVKYISYDQHVLPPPSTRLAQQPLNLALFQIQRGLPFALLHKVSPSTKSNTS